MTIIKMSLSSGILILAIVIIRTTMLYRLPKKTFEILWYVALYRLLIPFPVSSRFSVYMMVNMLKNKLFQTSIHFMTETASDVSSMDNAMTGVAPNNVLTDITGISMLHIVIFWLTGLSICALLFLATHFHHLKEYKTALPVDSEFIEKWQQDHLTWRRIRIRQSDKICDALTYGLLRPVILLPKTTDWTDETKLRYILTHEYVHVRRFDILYKLLLCISACVHWFNPLVWVMYVLANRDIELSCDENVVRIFGKNVRSSYALTLIELEEKKSLFSPLMNNFSKNAIEERTVSIMKTRKITLTSIILASALVTGTVIVFATTPIRVSAERDNTTMQEAFHSEIYSNETVTVNNSADLITMRDVVSLTNGITSPHNAANGHLIIYRNENESWGLSKGESLELEVNIENVFEDGQTTVIGYIIDGIYTDIFNDKIERNKTIEFTAPEDGEYAFYLIGASSDTIHIQSFCVK